jgi:hypothetical protein
LDSVFFSNKPLRKTGNTTFDNCTNKQKHTITTKHANRKKDPYVSPADVLLSAFLIDPPPGTGSNVSRRRTPGPGKRTVCERSLSTVFVRFVIEFDVIIDETGGPPLALVFNNICGLLLFDVDASILDDVSAELLTPLFNE